MARGRSSRPPSPHGIGGGEGIFSLLSTLAFMIAVGVWWWEQTRHQRPAPPRRRQPDAGGWLDEEERQRREIEWAKVHAREMQLLRENAERAREDRRNLYRRIARGWRSLSLLARSGFRYVILFGWFRDLPDWLQAIALGLVFAAPAVFLIVRLFRA